MCVCVCVCVYEYSAKEVDEYNYGTGKVNVRTLLSIFDNGSHIFFLPDFHLHPQQCAGW